MGESELCSGASECLGRGTGMYVIGAERAALGRGAAMGVGMLE